MTPLTFYTRRRRWGYSPRVALFSTLMFFCKNYDECWRRMMRASTWWKERQ